MPRFNTYKVTDKISVEDFNLASEYLESLVNMKVTGGRFAIGETGASLSIDSTSPVIARLVRLTSDLDAGSLTVPTTATAIPHFVSGLNEDAPPDIAVSDSQEMVIVNRNEDTTAVIDDIILVVRVNLDSRMEWQAVPGTVTTTTPESGGDTAQACGKCYKGTTLPGATECCKSFLRWVAGNGNPWHTGAVLNTGLVLTYSMGNTWLSEEFFGPANEDGISNGYRYRLTVNIGAESYLELMLSTDNNGDKVCLRYGCKSFQCLCSNVLTLKEPFGKIEGIDRSTVDCNVTLNPNDLTPLPTIPWINSPAGCLILEGQHVQFPGGFYLSVADATGCGNYSNGITTVFGVADSSTEPSPAPYTCGNAEYPYSAQCFSVNVNMNGTHLLEPTTGSVSGIAGCTQTNGLRCGGTYSVRPNETASNCGLPGQCWPVGIVCCSNVLTNVYVATYVSIALFEPIPDNWEIYLIVSVQVPAYDVDRRGMSGSGTATYTTLVGTLDATTATMDDWIALWDTVFTLSKCSDSVFETGPQPPFPGVELPDTVTVASASSPTAVEGGIGAESPTVTGACADDTCVTPVPPPQPIGCCCTLKGGIMHFVGKQECDIFGGMWFDNCDDAGGCSGEVGHCCMPDGRCIGSIEDWNCSAIGGVFDTGVACTGGCLGACCSPSGVCSITLEADCLALGGTFYGVGSDCTGRDCLGSCCCYSGGFPLCCLDAPVTEGECYALPLTDCDGGAGIAVWIASDDTCATCSGTC